MSKKEKNIKTSFYLMVDYDTDSGSNVQLFYKVGNDNDEYVEEVAESDIPPSEKIYRVSSKDHVLLFTQQKAKTMNKKKLYLRAAGGKPSIIRGLRPKEVYLTHKERAYLNINEKRNRIAPIGLPVDKYLKDNNLFGRTGKQKVVSLVVRGSDNVVLSWLKSSIGEYVKGAYTVLMLDEISDIEEFRTLVFESFRTSPSGVMLNDADEDIEHIVLTETELLPFVNKTKQDLYPIDDEIFKMPKMLVGGVFLVTSVAVGASTFLFNQSLQNKQTELMREERQLRNNKPDVDQFRRDKIKNHVSFFIENRNIDFESAFDASRKVWLPNSRIDLIVNRDQTTIRLYSRNGDGYMPQVFTDLVHELEAPENFTKGDIVATNNYENFEVTFTKNGR